MKTQHSTKKISNRERDRYEYFGEVIAPFENKWVALSSDLGTVLASGDSLKEVDEKLNEKQREEAVFHKVFPFDMAYVPRLIV